MALGNFAKLQLQSSPGWIAKGGIRLVEPSGGDRMRETAPVRTSSISWRS
jgi:hypothetical protein